MITPVRLPGVTIGEDRLTIIAGPCLAESLELCQEVAGVMQGLCREFGFNYIFKASYDKANRTSLNSVR
ncbi:MAG: 3-deoxy-8-phosphooctulonate synthase, partial [Fimbriimonas sp.]